MIVALTGGTGGAKLVEGFAAEIDPAELTVICNTGDDCDLSRTLCFAGYRHDHLHACRLERSGKRAGASPATRSPCWNNCGGWVTTPGSISAIKIWRRILRARGLLKEGLQTMRRSPSGFAARSALIDNFTHVR